MQINKFCFAILCLLMPLPCLIMAEDNSAAEYSLPLHLNIYSLPPFERAVLCIKYYEGWHTAKDYPYIGWGHRIRLGEKLSSNITHAQADSLLRSDLTKLCKLFEPYGQYCLLLAVLSYQVGPYRVLGNSTIPESNLIKKIKVGDSDIETDYLNYCHYKGKEVPSILRRRKMELLLLSNNH